MKTIFKIILLSVFSASAGAFATEHPHQLAVSGQQWTEGVVKKVDLEAGRITLKHAAIADLMPAMTMSYSVAPAPTALHAGDRVRFMLEKNEVTRIEVIK